MRRTEPILFSSISYEELHSKIDNMPIDSVLNQYIYLPKYGSGLREIYFMHIITFLDDNFHREDIFFDRITKRIYLDLKLVAEKVQQAKDLSETLPLMAILFYESIPTYYPTFNIPDFNWQQFALDVKLLFIHKNWLDLSLTMAEKEQLTGLTISQMELIEQTPKQARMSDLLAYCKGLRLDYRLLIPALESSKAN